MLQGIQPAFQTLHRSVQPDLVRAEEEARIRAFLHQHLRAVVILAGGVRTNPLAQTAKRPRAALPISVEETLLDHWAQHTQELAGAIDRPDLELRLLLSREQQAPSPRDVGALRFTRSEDADSFRGTGGLLRDVADDYVDDDLLLIVSGGQLMQEPLSQIALDLSRRRTAVTLAVRADGTPCDITLASARALRTIRGNGYVDFKEQSLPELARAHPVGVLRYAAQVTLPVRTLSQYIRALRAHHNPRGDDDLSDPYADSGQSRFVIVEPGAQVDPAARAFDSVMLAGSKVGAGALLVRSVVGPGAVVKPGTRAIDELIGA